MSSLLVPILNNCASFHFIEVPTIPNTFELSVKLSLGVIISSAVGGGVTVLVLLVILSAAIVIFMVKRWKRGEL